MDVRFYHLTRKKLESALPEILLKGLGAGYRIVVRTKDAKEREFLNETLWTHHPARFIPHGSEKDGNPDRQPVWLTDGADNPGRADMLVLTAPEAFEAADPAPFRLCCVLFDEHNDQAVRAARARWKDWTEAGHTLTYWQQTANGWEKKN